MPLLQILSNETQSQIKMARKRRLRAKGAGKFQWGHAILNNRETTGSNISGKIIISYFNFSTEWDSPYYASLITRVSNKSQSAMHVAVGGTTARAARHAASNCTTSVTDPTHDFVIVCLFHPLIIQHRRSKRKLYWSILRCFPQSIVVDTREGPPRAYCPRNQSISKSCLGYINWNRHSPQQFNCCPVRLVNVIQIYHVFSA